ncbi:MAG: isoprenoid biosynthesis glyoxalase ElbB [Sinobacterium sp.]|nr:isoprenoid biosynthesis glyoxalase ElbB [Sinobacterium sp.]
MSKKIAVILAGCGVYDGSEVYESVLTFLYIEEQGASYQAFAPNVDQHHVINHLNGEEVTETRNVLTESARIVRGNVKDISELSVGEYDAVIIPGGFGVAKNLSDFAFKGSDMQVHDGVANILKSFKQANKPIGLACIAPALALAIIESSPVVTIGNDADTISALDAMGVKHIECDALEAYIDDDNKLVTTPAFMLAETVSQAAPGIELLVTSVLNLCE